jgi:hypothetical protein
MACPSKSSSYCEGIAKEKERGDPIAAIYGNISASSLREREKERERERETNKN